MNSGLRRPVKREPTAAGPHARAVRQLVSGEAALAFARDGSLNLEHRSNQPLRVEVAVPTADWVLDAPDPNAA